MDVQARRHCCVDLGEELAELDGAVALVASSDHLAGLHVQGGEQVLVESNDDEEREYPDAEDQLREILIHGNYLSKRDIEVCLEFELSELSGDVGYSTIQILHDKLAERYAE